MDLYERLVSRTDPKLVDALLKVFAKRNGSDVSDFEPRLFCAIVEKAGTAENVTQIEKATAMVDSWPGDVDLKIEAFEQSMGGL